MRHSLLPTSWFRWPVLFAVLGVCLVINSIWLPAKAWLSQQLIAHSWHQALSEQKRAPPWPWADTFPVAEMAIPRLNKSLVLLHGVDPTSLAFSAGVMHQYAQFDDHSPIVVAGHRDTHFAFLEEVKMKDIISLTDEHGDNRLYQVEDLVIVDSNVDELAIDDNEANLILITCYPFNALAAGGSLRYVIKAKLLES